MTVDEHESQQRDASAVDACSPYLAMAVLVQATQSVSESGLSLNVWIVDSLRNLLAVTLGNIIGGSGLVALVYHAVYRRGLDRQVE